MMAQTPLTHAPADNLGNAIDRSGPGDAPAIIDLSTGPQGRVWTTAAFDALCDQVGAMLLRRGLIRGDRVAILSGNRVEMLATILGAMRAGLVAVPVNTKLPAETVGFILRDCEARLALTDDACAPLCPADLPQIGFGPEFDALLQPGPLAAVHPAPGEPAMFLYTSGSTGRPKGVVLSHASHLWVLDMRRRAPDAERQRMLVAAPLYHMNALAVCQAALAQQDTVILLPGFTAASYIAAIGTHRATALTSVPTMMAMMLRLPAALAATDLGSVQSIRMGSAPVSDGLMDAIRALFPHAAIANGYGTTEAGPVVFAPHPGGLPTPTLSVGVKHPAVDIRLVQADGTPIPDADAAEGVMQMRCPAQMNGYHNLPAATAKALTPDGYYITGDVFRRDADGFYVFVGRADDMFNCGGENIYPGEVELMLERHPGIAQACVVPVADDIKGAKPVAFVVARPGASLSEAEIKTYALAHAAAYQHPRRVWVLPELPLAGTNKVDRRALMLRAAQETVPEEMRQ